MSKVSYSQARAQLKKVCAGYVSHKKSQLNHLMAVSPSIPKNYFFEDELSGRDKPQRGFNDWVRCKYFQKKFIGSPFFSSLLMWSTKLFPPVKQLSLN